MPRFNRLASLFVASTLGTVASTACAQEPQGQAVVEVASISALPAAIRARLAGWYGEVSDRGGPFNPGCVVTRGTPRHRLVSAFVSDNLAVVEVEHGGIAHYADTLEFRSVNGSWKLVAHHDAPIGESGPHLTQVPAAVAK